MGGARLGCAAIGLRISIVIILCTLAAAPALAQKPAKSSALDQLRAGHTLLKKKRYGEAAKTITAAMNAGGLKRAEMAKALYYRGIAYRKIKQPAKAITDFTSALWLKGALSPSERQDAQEQRTAAYAEAGGNPSKPQRAKAAAPQRAPAKTTLPTRAPKRAASNKPKPHTTAWTTQTTVPPAGATRADTQPAASNSSGGNAFANFFSGLFSGGSQTTTEPSREQVETGATAPPSRSTSTTSVSAWSSETKTKPAAKKQRPRRQTSARQPPGRATAAGGRYVVQVAALPRRAAAEQLAARLAKRHASSLKGRQASVVPRVFGNMGTLYQVRVAAFPSKSAAVPFCRQLQADGLDCLVQAAN